MSAALWQLWVAPWQIRNAGWQLPVAGWQLRNAGTAIVIYTPANGNSTMATVNCITAMIYCRQLNDFYPKFELHNAINQALLLVAANNNGGNQQFRLSAHPV